jgi:hypothetical protein
LLLARPEVAKPTDVAIACVTLAYWAAAHAFGRTALLLAKASSAARPEDGSYALIVARVAERFGWYSHAESWLRRTVALARRQRDWVSYAEAFVSLGDVALADERLELADRNFMRAGLTARRRGLRAVTAKALHGRFRIALATGNDAPAVRYGEAALRAYRRSDGAFTALKYDLAAVKMRLAGTKTDTAEAFRLSASSPPPDAALQIEARLAAVREAAEKKDAALLADAWFTAVTAIEDMGETAAAAACLIRLVDACGGALERRRAQETLRRAREIATRAKTTERDSTPRGAGRHPD